MKYARPREARLRAALCLALCAVLGLSLAVYCLRRDLSWERWINGKLDAQIIRLQAENTDLKERLRSTGDRPISGERESGVITDWPDKL